MVCGIQVVVRRLSAVELELSQYVRVRELNGHWEGVMPVVLSDHSSQSHDVDDFKRMVSFLRNKGYVSLCQGSVFVDSTPLLTESRSRVGRTQSDGVQECLSESVRRSGRERFHDSQTQVPQSPVLSGSTDASALKGTPPYPHSSVAKLMLRVCL